MALSWPYPINQRREAICQIPPILNLIYLYLNPAHGRTNTDAIPSTKAPLFPQNGLITHTPSLTKCIFSRHPQNLENDEASTAAHTQYRGPESSIAATGCSTTGQLRSAIFAKITVRHVYNLIPSYLQISGSRSVQPNFGSATAMPILI